MVAKNQNVEEKNLQNPVDESTNPSNPVDAEKTSIENQTNPEEEAKAKAEEEAKAKAEEEAKAKEEKKNWKVTIKEESLKMFSLIKAPAEVKKIFDFYGITSQDVFDDTLKEKGLKANEIKTVKEWYATLI